MHVQSCCFAILTNCFLTFSLSSPSWNVKNPLRIARTDLGTRLHVAWALRLFLGERRETGLMVEDLIRGAFFIFDILGGKSHTEVS